MSDRTFRFEMTVEDQRQGDIANPFDCPGFRAVKRVLPNIRGFGYRNFRLFHIDHIGDSDHIIEVDVPEYVADHLMDIAMDAKAGLPPRLEHVSFSATIPEGYYPPREQEVRS